MKRIALLVISLTSFLLFSCSKNSDDVNLNQSIVGEWKILNVTIVFTENGESDREVRDYAARAETSTLNFTADRAFEFRLFELGDNNTLSLQRESGTYTIEGNTLNLNFNSDDNDFPTYDYTIQNNILTIVGTEREDSISVTSTIVAERIN